MIHPRMLIAIPCYNCAKQIPRVLSDLFNQNFMHDIFPPDVLLIDNQSQDGTLDSIKQFMEASPQIRNLRWLQNSCNLGLGGTQKVAFSIAKHSGYDFLIILHGDHQASADDIPKLLHQMKQTPSAAVLGSRFSVGSERLGYSKIRVIGNRILNFIYSVATRRRIQDLGSGLNLFRLCEFNLERQQEFSDQFTFNMDLLLHLVSENKSFCFVPIRWTEFDQISNARNFIVGWETLKTLYRWKVG